MHNNMLERRFSRHDQVRALRMRAEELERRAAASSDTTSTKQIVTKTVVVPVKATSATSTSAAPAQTTTSSTSQTSSQTSTLTTTSSTSSTTTARATTSSSTSISTPKPATTTNRAVTSPNATVSGHNTSSTVLSPTVDSANSNAKTTSGLSSGATVGIVAGVIIAAMIVVIFIVRKTFIRRRERKRNTWGAGFYPSTFDEKNDTTGERQGLTTHEPVPTPITSSSFGTTANGFATTPQTPAWSANKLPPIPSMAATATTPSLFVTPPPASYNNAFGDDAYGGMAPAMPAASSADTAVVSKNYLPTLDDELSINVGEVVQVLRAFDDGWALCQNARGDKGVVPLQCLDWAQNAQAAVVGGYGQNGASAANGDWRNTKRLSSLSGHAPRY